jgi:hypothetical protein
VAGTAIVAAGGALTGHVFHELEHGRTRAHPRIQATRQALIQVSRQPYHSHAATAATSATEPRVARSSTVSAHSTQRPTTRTLPQPPSRGLGYLAVGSPAGAARSASPSEGSARAPSAQAASVARASSSGESAPPSESSASSSESSPPPSESPPPAHAPSGGGTSLGYLGH